MRRSTKHKGNMKGIGKNNHEESGNHPGAQRLKGIKG